MDIIRSITRIARKEHVDTACKYIREAISEGWDVPADIKPTVDRLLVEQRGRILKGHAYHDMAGADGGEIYTWKLGIESSAICDTFKFWPEE